jgi:hypothetical protein
MLQHQPEGSYTVIYFYNGFSFLYLFSISKCYLHSSNMDQSLSVKQNGKKGEEWQKNADTDQQYQAAATAGLVCARKAARESNINTEPMNKEGWNIRAAECYRQPMASFISLLTECGQRNIPQAMRGQITAIFSYKNWTHTHIKSWNSCLWTTYHSPINKKTKKYSLQNFSHTHTHTYAHKMSV